MAILIYRSGPIRRMIVDMAEMPEPRARPNTVAKPPWVALRTQQGEGGGPSRLSRVLAGVGIVAAVVFVVAVIILWFLVGL